MKLALLGVDDDALALVHWAVTQGNHELTAAYDLGARAAEVKAIARDVSISDIWEELLVGRVADAVIIGRGGADLTQQTDIPDADRRADQLRKLAQAAIPMIVVCPACEAIVGFEIEMIRHDVQGVIVPFIPGANHPAMLELQNLASNGESSPLSPIEQITLHREQSDRSRATVMTQLARDVTLLRRLIGDVQSVSASGPVRNIGRDPMGPKSKEPLPLTNLNVHFTGSKGLAAHWSIAPSAGADQAKLTLAGHSGKAALLMPSAGLWSLESAIPRSTPAPLASYNEPEHVFAELSHMLVSAPNASPWLSACRDQEAAEAVDRSLARGRTIELFNEQHTEEASFKGVMAMGGCLLLMVALAAVLVATLVDSLRLPVRDFGLWRMWPVFLLAPLALFLVLQLLQTAIKRDSSPASPSIENSASGK